jgi:cytochrome c oxidase subunit 5b
MFTITDVRSEDDLVPEGAKVGTVPTDLEQATGLDRLEILGKMQGVDIFDMKPLDASRKGALQSTQVLECFIYRFERRDLKSE